MAHRRPNQALDIRTAFAPYVQPPPRIEDPATVLASYRARMLERYGRISMIGVMVDDFEFGMDDVYVPLRFVEAPAEMKLQGKRQALGEPGQPISVDDIFQQLHRNEVPTIMGEAGSGKTTALTKLLHTVFTQPSENLRLPAETVPCFLRLARLKDTTDSQNLRPGRHWIQGPLGRLLEAALTPEEWAVLSANDRPLFVLFDGLDEIADPRRRQQALRLIDSAVQADPNLWVVVSCRHSARGYAIDFPPRFKRFTVQPLDDESRRRLTLKWFMAANHTNPECQNPQEEAKAQTDALFEAVGPVYALDPHLRTLVSTPLFATLQCVLHLAQPELPQNSVQFLLAALEVLLERKQRCGAERRPDEATADALKRVLEDVSLRIQESARQEGLKRHEWAEWLWEAIEVEIPDRDDDDWRRWLERHRDKKGRLDRATVCWLHQDADLLTELTQDELSFRHRSFQEVLAAHRLVHQGRPGLAALAQNADGQTWRQPFLYAARILGAKGFNALARPLLRRPDWPQLEDVLQETFAHLSLVDPAPFITVFERGDPAACRVVMNLFRHRTDDRVTPLRAAALKALSRTQDKIFRSELEVFAGRAPRLDEASEQTTGIRFLRVPGGTFSMGSNDYDDEKPVHPVTVSSFWLAATPVTNAQYRPFVEATEKAPRYWNDSRYNKDEQPVVGVSWHDAAAFCEWLPSPLNDHDVRLPTEAQWERTAKGDDNRKYPWGNDEPDETRAWFGQIGVYPKPVGQYPAGIGPYSHLDLAGNVWEWCRDVYDSKAYDKQPHSNLTQANPEVTKGDKARVVRGGSYWDGPSGLRTASRGGSRPHLDVDRARGLRPLLFAPNTRVV